MATIDNKFNEGDWIKYGFLKDTRRYEKLDENTAAKHNLHPITDVTKVEESEVINYYKKELNKHKLQIEESLRMLEQYATLLGNLDNNYIANFF